MKVHDTTVSGRHGSDTDKKQHLLLRMILESCQIAYQGGLTPLELVESIIVAAAHVADKAKLRSHAAALLRSWADDLEKTDTPVALEVGGTA